VLTASVAVSAVAVSTWAATRLPAFGQREAIGVLDLAASALELLTIGTGLSLLRRPVQPRPAPALRTPALLVAAAVAAMSTTTVPTAHADHHHGSGKASAPDEHHGNDEAAGAHDGSTRERPIFGDLFADHHATPGTGHDENAQPRRVLDPRQDASPGAPLAEDGHAQAEPHEHLEHRRPVRPHGDPGVRSADPRGLT
jgi:hypothetical protein